MPTISEVKKDQQFYRSFFSLIEVLKNISASQFHALEKRIKLFPELNQVLENMLGGINLQSLNHSFINPQNLPIGIVVVTSDAGLLGGMNYKLMTQALSHCTSGSYHLVVIGTQGQKFMQGKDIPYKSFPGIIDNRYLKQSQDVRDYVFKEAVHQRLGALKVIFPYAASMSTQQILEWNFFPCREWPKACIPGQKEDSLRRSDSIQPSAGILLESGKKEIIEYISYLWMGQKLFEIFQLSRLAEHAARVMHLEDSSQKIKEIEKKLKLKYFRIHHEIIDQQMRELFTARSIYA